MNRERALKVVLVVVGSLFSAAIYPLMMMVKQDPALAMMMSLYATLGVFLLLATRNPSEHRSLIAFTAWSSFAHAALMAVQAFLNLIPRRELVGVVVFILIPDRAGSGEVSRAGIGSRCVGNATSHPETNQSGVRGGLACSRYHVVIVSTDRRAPCGENGR